MSSYTMQDLEIWDDRIQEKILAFGLNCFPQEFEICDHHDMLAYMAYSGMPSHYPHWSYGKSFEKLKTLYDYGVSGLPYEMVINANPTLAYLMKDNTLLLQILTIAHVYGHNDFFKNNFTFQTTRPEYVLGMFKSHGTRIRKYMEDPQIGIERLEPVLDAAHAVSLQCRRNMAIKKLTVEEQQADAIQRAMPPPDPFHKIHARQEYVEPDLHKNPLNPEEDILLFIRDNNPFLESWEKDVLTMVHEEAQYFIPQIETKIMNEGWASYWHKTILDSLDLPQELYLEFLVRHNQVIRPHEGSINPYHIGFKVWEGIRKRFDDTPQSERAEKLSHPSRTGLEMMFAVRETDRDTAFLRRHLTNELIRELDLFQYVPQKDEADFVINRVADEDDESYRIIRDTLIANIGTNSIPVIKVHDADFGGNRTLYLEHEYDGRDLDGEYAKKTLEYLFALWRREVALATVVQGKRVLMKCNKDGVSSNTIK